MVPRTSPPSRLSSPTRTQEFADREPVGVLKDPHCMHFLDFLRRADGPVPLSVVSRYVVGTITDTRPDEVSGSVQRRTQTWFHHGIAPELAAKGFVDFDPEAGTVALTDPLS